METLISETPKISTLQPKYAGWTMSKKKFLKWESDDEFVYEFNQGLLEPTKSMKQQDVFIIRNIEDAFYLSYTFENRLGRLFTEIDCWVSELQMRRPDIAFYTAEQIKEMAVRKNVIPSFVVEIISNFDDMEKAEQKLREFFSAGVKVLWRILPNFKTVYVFTSTKEVKICMDDDVVSASPAIEDLQLTCNQLFAI